MRYPQGDPRRAQVVGTGNLAGASTNVPGGGFIAGLVTAATRTGQIELARGLVITLLVFAVLAIVGGASGADGDAETRRAHALVLRSPV